MKLHFVRSGGFAAALRREAEADTDALPPPEAEAVAALVAGSDFFRLPESIRDPNHPRDQFVYRVTIEQGGRRHTVEVDETVVPAALQPLLDWLIRRARPGVAAPGDGGPD
jgi:emfourin